jgi:uncharacterized membrane protein YfcA
MHLSLVDLAAITLLGVLSGSLGAITGIGGGVIIVPTLVLVFGLDFPTAVTASLAAVIATSTTTGSAYVGEGLTNMRLAMTLEVATTAGGISGGFLGLLLPERVLSAIFAAAMITTGVLLARGSTDQRLETADGWAADATSVPTNTGPLDARYLDPEAKAKVVYRVERVPSGMSGLLGVGGGFIKVPAMNLVMGVPLKVAAATSNFMIGVTAVSSLLVYLGRGEMHPVATTPLIIGTVFGGLSGVRLQGRIGSRGVQLTLAAILGLVAIQMALRAAGVGVG